MTQNISLPWGNNQADFALTQEIAAIHFRTPATMPAGKVQLKVFEIDNSPPSKMKGVFNTTPGSMTEPLLMNASSTEAGGELTCSETPAKKPGHPPHPAQLVANTDYYLNVQSLDNTQPAFNKRATIRIPKN